MKDFALIATENLTNWSWQNFGMGGPLPQILGNGEEESFPRNMDPVVYMVTVCGVEIAHIQEAHR